MELCKHEVKDLEIQPIVSGTAYVGIHVRCKGCWETISVTTLPPARLAFEGSDATIQVVE